MTLLLFLATGFAGSFMAAVPIGPINLWVASQILGNERPPRGLYFFLAGVIAAESGLVFSAFFATDLILTHTLAYAFWLQLVMGVVLIAVAIVGIRGLIQHKQLLTGESISAPSSDPKHALLHFLKGAALLLSGPGFFVVWTGFAALFHQSPHTPNGIRIAAFIVGVILGDFAWFGLYFFLLRQLKARTKGRWLTRIQFACFAALGVAGIFALSRSVLNP